VTKRKSLARSCLGSAARNYLIFLLNGAPGGIRTHDPCLRRAVLYPAELRARAEIVSGEPIRRLVTPWSLPQYGIKSPRSEALDSL
jgi:hypothetical protein